MKNKKFKDSPPLSFQDLFLEAMDDKKNPRNWIEYKSNQVWGGYEPTILSPKTFQLNLLSFDKKLSQKTTQEIHLRGIYGATLHSNLESSKNARKINNDEIIFRINSYFLDNPYRFEYVPSKHIKSGLILFNQWHISPFTITNAFDPGITIVHGIRNYGLLIEDETPTSKIFRFNSGAKPYDAPITFDDIVVRLEEIE